MDGVTIGDKHSLNDLQMYLKRKVISAPEVQTRYVEVPQRDGKIDLSESLTGLVKYYNRNIEMQFVLIDEFSEYQSRFSEIENYLHGKRMKLIFDDDIDNFFVGRLTVTASETDKRSGILNISAECDPYKYEVVGSDDYWLWDPFDFEDGVINEYIDIEVNGTRKVSLYARRQVTYPTISTDAAMTVTFDRNVYNLAVGENKMYDILLPEGENELIFNGHGTITIRYRGGSL